MCIVCDGCSGLCVNVWRYDNTGVSGGCNEYITIPYFVFCAGKSCACSNSTLFMCTCVKFEINVYTTKPQESRCLNVNYQANVPQHNHSVINNFHHHSNFNSVLITYVYRYLYSIQQAQALQLWVYQYKHALVHSS